MPAQAAGVLLVYFIAVRWIILGVSGVLELGYPPAVAVMAGIIVGSSGFYRRWLFWRPAPQTPIKSAFETFVAVVALVEVFTITATVFARHGWLHVAGYHGALPGKSHLLAGLERDFLWNSLDAIPSLNVPSTLNWPHPAHALTGYSGGVVMLAFKLLVIVPVIGLVVELVNRKRTTRLPLPRSELSTPVVQPEARGGEG